MSPPPTAACAFVALAAAAALPQSANGFVQNTTMYRVTPKNYTGMLANMDTGDINGDCAFGLLELTLPYWCKDNPNWLSCQNVPILSIPGFNVYESHTVEHDSHFGEYNRCNPNPNTGVFECEYTKTGCWWMDPVLAPVFAGICKKEDCYCAAAFEQSVGRDDCAACNQIAAPTGSPPQCSPLMFLPNAIFTDKPLQTANDTTLGDCCTMYHEAASGPLAAKFGAYNESSRTCTVFTEPVLLKPGQPKAQILYEMGGGFNGSAPLWLNRITDAALRLQGKWYSTRSEGECKAGQAVGDGCYWRDLGVQRTINATCLANNLVLSISEQAPECFERCGKPLNTTSECTVECVFEAALGKSGDVDVCRGFRTSFEKKDPAHFGCPDVVV
eukprot:Rhum_TRINITY_DN13669_c0_g1::Rhum_TRINITY_DN13669_c0_g1_i1::g.62828::m.62828